jgi:hypothetical protein
MDNLLIERTDNSPKVLFDPTELFFTIKGISRPENADKFYMPVVNWLEKFAAQRPATSTPVNIEIKLTYFNSSTIRYLSDVFRIFSKLHDGGMRVIIDWYVDSDDELIREAGQELSDVSGLPFNFIEE